jgi:hypothetical protein
MFEAGALSKNLDRSKVCPILFGIEPSDIAGPLVQFQGCVFSRSEMERVLRMINSELGESALAGAVIDDVFEMWWPKLEEKIAAELAKADPEQPSARSDRELLEEVLALSRSTARDRRGHVPAAAVDDLLERFDVLVEAVEGAAGPDAVERAVRQLRMPLGYVARRLGATLATSHGYDHDIGSVGSSRTRGRVVRAMRVNAPEDVRLVDLDAPDEPKDPASDAS